MASSVPAHVRDAILWQEIYEQALALGMDSYSAEIYATETLADIEEIDDHDRYAAYHGEY